MSYMAALSGNGMSSEKRKLCPYGEKCYRKNADHKNLYFHPPKDEDKSKRDGVAIASELSDLKSTDDSKIDAKELIKEKFLVDMPEDFYLLWTLAKEIEPQYPRDFLSGFQLKLVGPYCALDQKIAYKLRKAPVEDCLSANRFYYDVPEFQTLVISLDSSFHIGYFRDDPAEMPSIVCSNRLEDECKLSLMGDNILGALHSHLSSKYKQQSLNDHDRLIIERLANLAEEHCLSLTVASSQKIKARKKLVVANTFHGIGIVVPVVNDVGYRCIGENPATLKKWLKIIDETDEEAIRNEKLDKIHEIMNYVQFANDECDYGMGLELGVDLFCSGCRLVHQQIKQLLTVAYLLLNRETFAKILAAHLERRSEKEPFRFDFE